MPQLSAPCDITVLDFSQDNLSIQHLDNNTLGPFLKREQADWVKCRWINVNGLSWDVIQALGKHKKLHKLAIEDIMNTRNRTKAEWCVLVIGTTDEKPYSWLTSALGSLITLSSSSHSRSSYIP